MKKYSEAPSVEIRRKKILAMLSEEQFLRTKGLSETFGISQVSIRKDLNYLEKRGLIKRARGGAQPTDDALALLALSERYTIHRLQKEMIGWKAATLLDRPNLRIYLDTGTTTLQLARHIPENLPVVVYTSSLTTIAALEARPLAKVFAMGGRVDFKLKLMSGPMTDAHIDRLQFDLSFLGADTVGSEGFGCVDMEYLETIRRVMARSSRVFVLADSSKLTRRSSATYASPSEVTAWITDEGAPPEVATALEVKGTQVIRVPLKRK